MDTIDNRTRAYLACVYAAGLAATIGLALSRPHVDAVALAIFAGLAFVSECAAVDMPRSGKISVSVSIVLAALLLFGPALAALAAAIAEFNWPDISDRQPAYKLLFNASQAVLSVCAAAVVYQAAGGSYGGDWSLTQAAVPTVMAAVTFITANALLVSGVIAVSLNASLVGVLRANFVPFAGNDVALVVLSLVLVEVYSTVGPAGVVLLVAPLLVARQTLQVYMQLKNAYGATVRSFVAAIEAKDAYTRGHSERVAGYAETIARQLNMSEDSIEKLRIAALLHDLGKLGIQRRILSKTGRLTEDEFGLMQEHPELATAILRDVGFLEDIIPAIYHHHEHYDGSGYVRNLKGEQIPLTARILAVADAYDAMISARPYRDALTPELAAAELVSCSGSQFDRKAVDALLAATGVRPKPTEDMGVSEGQLRLVDETT